ncbi:MAG: HNH endonuclease [Chlorobi bacterium]|nr:HNH endonuclease [Chlorobiota bacterium]
MGDDMTKKPENRTQKNQGMNWISQHKRLAIYMRDGLACAYCGDGVEDGAKLTLDHLTPYSEGGSNHETNLVTCCHRCNSSRGNRSVEEFASGVAAYLNHGVKVSDITAHISDCTSRPLDIKAAKEMIARRGSCAKVIAPKA